MSISKKILFDKGDVISWSVAAPGFYTESQTITMQNDSTIVVDLRLLPEDLFVWDDELTKKYYINGEYEEGLSPVRKEVSGIIRRLTSIDPYQFEIHKSTATDVFVNARNMTSLKGVFAGPTYEHPTNLTRVVVVETDNIVNMREAFASSPNLTELPMMNTSNVTNIYEFAANCKSLVNIPNYDFTKVSNAFAAFFNCNSLTSFPITDMPELTDAGMMFEDCDNLSSVSLRNTPKLKNATNMFTGASIENIVDIDYTNIESASAMYAYTKIKRVDELILPNCTAANELFAYCADLEYVGTLSLPICKSDVAYMFKDTPKLTEIGSITTDCQRIGFDANINTGIQHIGSINAPSLYSLTIQGNDDIRFGVIESPKLGSITVDSVDVMSNIVDAVNSKSGYCVIYISLTMIVPTELRDRAISKGFIIARR